ncbi:hypothetical protein [Shewanella marina]|uniref:hypothetical protein n=1 Tax=Shewanella marina TaxID=487319 RepID=UPI00046F9CFB|nr:hypothetical protein [Shewanella marina]
MLYLFASCIALLIGPLFYRYFSSGSGLQKGLDGFIFVSLGGLVLIHILPELLEHGGLMAIVFVILGLWGPTLSERIFHRYSEITHNLTLILGVGGLMLHTITDGGAMVLAQHGGNSPLLALGVILHRLPVGLAIWWLLRPQIGLRWSIVVLASMMLLTSLGYFAGEHLLAQLSLDNTVYLQAFVTGSILHVVLHQPHGTPEDKKHKYEYQAGIGSLLGIGLLILLLTVGSDGHDHGGHDHGHSTEQLVEWMFTIAPVLLLAYVTAAIRFALGLSPRSHSLAARWLQRLAGPEALIITALLLSPWYALAQAVILLVIGAFLTLNKVQLIDPHASVPQSALCFGLLHLVDRSAPWVLLSLVLANLIGHPAIPLEHPALQVVILLLVFLPMRFCNLGAAVLALALAYSGWSTAAVMLALVAAPLISIDQLKLLKRPQQIGLVALIIAGISLAAWSLPARVQLLHLPASIEYLCLIAIAGLFAASLLRQGPRQFLRRLVINRPAHHHHEHAAESHGHHHH